MPPVFRSGQFLPGACGQGNTSLQDRRVLPQGQAAATPAWTGAEGGPSWRERLWPHPQTAENRNVMDGISWTPANTKKSLQTISRLKTLSKHGGFLLSHLVWQYHRR